MGAIPPPADISSGCDSCRKPCHYADLGRRADRQGGVTGGPQAAQPLPMDAAGEGVAEKTGGPRREGRRYIPHIHKTLHNLRPTKPAGG